MVWMVVIAGVTVAWQIVRLQQTDWLWYPYDYAGRLVILGLLAIDPTLRAAIFRRDRLKISLAIVINWGLLLIPGLWLVRVLTNAGGAVLPDLRLGFYPMIHGPLYLFDMSFGLVLTAFHEEFCFRRAVPFALARLGNGTVNNIASALLFGAFHWWTGIPNMVYAAVFGIIALAIYRRSGVLWPIIAIHYIADFVALS